jgi:hypothetical protein
MQQNFSGLGKTLFQAFNTVLLRLPASSKNFPYRTRSTRSVEPLGDIPVMTEMILCRGKASGRYHLTMALSLLIHLPEFTPSGFGLYPLYLNKTRHLKP